MKLLPTLALALVPSLGLVLELGPSPSLGGDDANPVAWLEGHWVGEGLGGQVEEVWLAPADGAMTCVFRLVLDGKPSFYELVTVTRTAGEPGGWEMRLKHFHPDLVGWEERGESLVWAYEPLGEKAARFGPATYELLADGTLRATVELEQDGTVETEELLFRRKE